MPDSQIVIVHKTVRPLSSGNMGKKNKMKVIRRPLSLGTIQNTDADELAQTLSVGKDASRSHNPRSDDNRNAPDSFLSDKKQTSGGEDFDKQKKAMDNAWNSKNWKRSPMSNVPIKQEEHSAVREESTFASRVKSTPPSQRKVEYITNKPDRVATPVGLQNNTSQDNDKHLKPTNAIVTRQPVREDNDVNPSQEPNCSKSLYEIPQQRRSSKEQDFLEIEKLIEDSRTSKLKIREMKGDLFSAPESYSLCHCVAEDLSMGSGIAVAFKEKFKHLEELMQQRQKTGGLAVLQDKSRYIYYLVTKEFSRGKPTLRTLFESLLKMRNHMKEQNVTKLAMPAIGCGLDRLDWSRVSKLIKYVFRDDEDIEVDVYMLDQGKKRKRHNYRTNTFKKPKYGHNSIKEHKTKVARYDKRQLLIILDFLKTTFRIMRRTLTYIFVIPIRTIFNRTNQ